MAGKSSGAVVTRYAGLQVQTSSLGVQIPVGWGTFRCKCNLVDYLDFKAKAQKAAAGKGGSTTTGYSYSASLILALCEGPIDAITTAYVNGKVYVHGSTSGAGNTGPTSALAQAGLTLATGAIGQAVWSYLTSSHPDHAIGYSGLAVCYASNYPLDSGASTPNHSFEIVRTSSFGVSGTPDADPSLVVLDFFTNTRTGVPSWNGPDNDPTYGAALIDAGSLAQYQDYCLAAGLLVSPVIDAQRSASDFLTELLRATNSTCVWSEGVLKFIPYGDTAMTGNGKTYTPNTTPVYSLTDDDYIPKSDGDPPVLVDLSDQSDAYNVVQLEYLDRTNQYNMAIALSSDAANIAQYGMRRKDPDTVHCICTPAVAQQSSQLFLQRTLYIRATYKFSLSWKFDLLEPGDLLEITDTQAGLNAYPVRITQIDEAADGELDLTCEDFPIGISAAPLYTMQSTNGFVTNKALDPGGVEANLLLHSQDFTFSAWTKNAVTITAGAAVDPLPGATDAQKIVASATNAIHSVAQPLAVFGGIPYTLSGYFAPGARKRIYLQLASTTGGSSAQARVGVDLSTGLTFTTAYASGGAVIMSSSISAPIVVSGVTWYQVSITAALQTSDSSANAVIEICDDSGNETWTGDGTNGILAWGIQLSQGLDLRPYAATAGTLAGPLIFNPPSVLTTDGKVTWAAVAGGTNWGGCNVWASVDGSSYSQIGTIDSAARFGVTTATFGTGSDPDTTNTLAIDLGRSAGVLSDVSNSAADASSSLCLVDGELISFSDADLTSPYAYSLVSYIRRGVMNTAVASHAAGAPFVRLDSSIFELPYLSTQEGVPIYVKFQSFNHWGEALQDLAHCNPYDVTPNVVQVLAPGASAWTAAGGTLSSGGVVVPALIITGASDNPDATGIAFFYRTSSGVPWKEAGLSPASATHKDITSVIANTSYQVGVAYLVSGVLTPVQLIGTVTTGDPGFGPLVTATQVTTGIVADNAIQRITFATGGSASGIGQTPQEYTLISLSVTKDISTSSMKIEGTFSVTRDPSSPFNPDGCSVRIYNGSALLEESFTALYSSYASSPFAFAFETGGAAGSYTYNLVLRGGGGSAGPYNVSASTLSVTEIKK